MKIPVRLFTLLAPLAAFAAEPAGIDLVIGGVPTTASEVVIVVDTAAPPAPGYEDPAAAPAASPAPASPPPAADPAAPRRRRRGGAGGAAAGPAVATPPFRQAIATGGATSVTAHIPRAAGANYRVRVIAIQDDGKLPAVLAGGHADGIKVTAGRVAPVAVGLKSPALKFSAANPAAVAAGAKFTLAGTITDAAQCLGTKNRMRVWISAGEPPGKNYAGTQTSTVDVTTKGDDVEFSFNLTAPKTPAPLFFQFGEIPPDFARADGTQAPFLVLPNLTAGASALQVRVEPPAAPGKS